MPAYYDVHGGVLRHESGFSKDLTDDPVGQLVFEDSERGREFRRKRPDLVTKYKRSNKDYRRSLPYRIGQFINEKAGITSDDIGGVGRFFEEHPILGTGIGILGGAALGLGGSAISNNLFAERIGEIDPTLATLGLAAAGGGLGWLVSYLRNSSLAPHTHEQKYNPNYDAESKTVKEPKQMKKSAAMYQDPRNFILEKLQSDYTLDFGAKASLAAKVRSLNPDEAEKLAKLVRQAVGIGVGALIAKFVFGTGVFGTALGGLAGLGMYNYLSNRGINQSPLNIIPRGNPYTYNSII